MEAVESVTRQAALAVLDAYWLQQKVLAANIANHATPGYQAQSVDFESYLTDLGLAMRDASRGNGLSAIESMAPPRLHITGSEVQLDSQLAELAKNTLQYQAVLTALSRLESLDQLALGGATR